MKFSLLKSRFSRRQGINGPGHAVGETGHEVESDPFEDGGCEINEFDECR